MKYLKFFQNENEYLSYKDSSDYITPNISMIFENRSIRYQKKIKKVIQVGDIAYWDGSSVKTTPLSSWNTSLGTPVGVVVIPKNFLPDGKARIISLTNMTYNGNEYIVWDEKNGYFGESSVPNFKYVPTTDNMGSTTYGTDICGYLPSDSDSFTGVTSFLDSKAKYNGETPYIPSPYMGNKFNPAYSQTIEGGNALSDFNGLSNTQSLVNEGEQYHAAHACWNYKDPANSNLQWYLPAMGELGFLTPRFQLINQSIQAVGGVPVDGTKLWSSTEFVIIFGSEEYYVWGCFCDIGFVDGFAGLKDSEDSFVRGIAMLNS